MNCIINVLNGICCIYKMSFFMLFVGLPILAVISNLCTYGTLISP